MKKVFYIFAGMAALVLGIAGTVLPVVPTTPLLLFALYCFTKGSNKISSWFIKTKIYNKYLSEYMQRKALTFKQKIFIQIFAGAMMITSFLLIDYLIVRIILTVAFAAHNYVFIFKIKTYKEEKADDLL